MVQWIQVAVQNSKLYMLIFVTRCSLDADTALAKSLHIFFSRNRKNYCDILLENQSSYWRILNQE